MNAVCAAPHPDDSVAWPQSRGVTHALSNATRTRKMEIKLAELQSDDSSPALISRFCQLKRVAVHALHRACCTMKYQADFIPGPARSSPGKIQHD